MPTVPRIMIVDDHELAREGLRSILVKGGFEVVADAENGEQAVALASRLRPDAVLMDIRLGHGIDGLEAARQITALGLPTRILMLTLHDSPGYVREALAAGAAGYVLKDTGIDELRDAISRVLDGQMAIPLALMTSALQRAAPHRPAPIPNEEALGLLTGREGQVLELICEGLTNKEIARQLGISPATVKVHVERLISKLGVSDRTQAAVLAARQDRLG